MCQRPVCPACLAPETCPAPSVRELRLDMGARLREVDPLGRHALINTWTGKGRLVDLATGKILMRDLPLAARGSSPAPMLTAGDTLVSVLISLYSSSQNDRLRVVRLDDLIGDRDSGDRMLGSGGVTFRAMTKSNDGRLVVMTHSDETAAVFDVVQRRMIGTFSVPGQVLHSVAACAETDMLALGTYGRVSFFRLSDQQRMGSRRIDDGNVRWIGLGRRRFAAITEKDQCSAVNIDPSHPPQTGAGAGAWIWTPTSCPR